MCRVSLVGEMSQQLQGSTFRLPGGELLSQWLKKTAAANAGREGLAPGRRKSSHYREKVNKWPVLIGTASASAEELAAGQMGQRRQVNDALSLF